MKKIMAVLAVFVLAASSGCGKKVTQSGSESSGEVTTSPAAETTAAETEASRTETTTAPTEEQTTEAEGYVVNSDGGVEFSAPISKQSIENLIAAGNELFTAACNTEWEFTVGSPYELDTTQTVQNSLGWDFYLITDERINSLADIQADYHKVFSESYKDSIGDTFMEKDGRAYCLNGARGDNIFYERSEFDAVKEKTENQITYLINNYYSDDGFGNGAYVSSEEFITVRDSDGVWRVQKFKLPY